VPAWTFLTNHARVLLCVAHDPGVRLRDIAASLSITERSAYSIVSDLTETGYLVKHKDGRRNRYRVQGHLPLAEAATRQATVGELLALLLDSGAPSGIAEGRMGASGHPAPTGPGLPAPGRQRNNRMAINSPEPARSLRPPGLPRATPGLAGKSG
jgi:hypothetical protein